jgi:hypothetical protein
MNEPTWNYYELRDALPTDLRDGFENLMDEYRRLSQLETALVLALRAQGWDV